MNCKKNVEESRRLGKHKDVRAKRGQCYANAFRVVLHVPEYASATYVEGFALLYGGIPIEHGWVECDGEIIDPTLPEERMVYFPGLRFEGQTGVAKAMLLPKPNGTKEDFPIFYRFGWGGWDSPQFRKAYEDAWAYAREQSKARSSVAATGDRDGNAPQVVSELMACR